MALPNVPFDQWLSAKQVAGEFGLKEDSAYRWHKKGFIPEEFVRCGRRRRFNFYPAIITHLEKTFAALHK